MVFFVSKMSNNFKKISLNILILLCQGIYFGAKLLLAWLEKFIFRPVYGIGRKTFGKIIIKLYGQILTIKTKLNLNSHERFGNILLSRYAARITVVGLAFFITGINLFFDIKQTSAINEENAPKPILFYLIKNEFDSGNELVVETSDQLTPVFSGQNYLNSAANLKVQPQAEMKAVGESAAESEDFLVYGGSAVVKPNLAQTKKIQRPRTAIVYHRVQPGETVSTIAQKYDITVSTILWENNLTAYSLIRPGDTLAILPASGISYTVQKGDTLQGIAKRYNVEVAEISNFNKIADSSYLKSGQKIIIPGGSKKYTAPTVASYSGLDALRQLVVPPSAAAVHGNKMNWPTVGRRITQYYSWRHTGVDIANKIGTAIYAADAGTVVYAGWSNGYGNNIIIDHGGGKKTRYAHASKLYVKVGQWAEKGQTIAAMGSTGNSTGPHLHFEVIINNVRYNPLDYIK